MADTPRCEPCEHIATLTDRMHAVVGPWRYTSPPMAVCVTCRAVIDRDGLTLPVHFQIEESR